MRTAKQTSLLALVATLSAPGVAGACAVCYGDPNSPIQQGVDQAVIFMLGVIGTMLAMFGSLFGYWIYRHGKNEELLSRQLATHGVVN